MMNIFSQFLTSVVSIRKPDGKMTAEKIQAGVDNSSIEIHDSTLVIDRGDIVIRYLPNGREEFYEVRNVDFKDGMPGHIPDWITLQCVRIKEPMPQFGSQYPVTIVRARGTADEKTWEAQMGGDLNRKALFYIDDRIKTGDEIHSEVFDEPRIISRVNPSLLLSGVSHWEAEIMPQSEWQRHHRQPMPNIAVSGQGARVNVGSVDHSSQHFHNAQTDNAAMLHVLEEIKAVITQTAHSPAEKHDAGLDVEQLKMELQRSKPDKSLISTLVQRISALAGLAEAVAKLPPLLQSLGLFHQE